MKDDVCLIWSFVKYNFEHGIYFFVLKCRANLDNITFSDFCSANQTDLHDKNNSNQI